MLLALGTPCSSKASFIPTRGIHTGSVGGLSAVEEDVGATDLSMGGVFGRSVRVVCEHEAMKRSAQITPRRRHCTPTFSPFESIRRRARSTPTFSPFESITKGG